MKPRDLALGVLVAVIWGSNFSVIGLGLRSLDPFLLTALRFLCSALPLVFVLAPPKVPARAVIAYGITFGVGLWWVVNVAMARGMSPGLGSLLLQSSAFFTILLSRVVFGEAIGRARWLGMAAAAAGLALIIAVADGRATRVGAALVILAALAWSACNLLVKRYRPADMLAFIVWSSAVSAPVLFLLTFLGEGARPFVQLAARLDARALFSILFQAYVTTVFGYWVWNRLIARYSAAQVAPLSLLVPVSGLLTSWLVFDERLSLAAWLGVALVLAGMVRLTFPGRWISPTIEACRAYSSMVRAGDSSKGAASR
jgi:O-acetylserine/cysteine efflux transporter